MEYLSEMSNAALVFSGGGLKGAAFAGALRALAEEGLRFDLFGGCSAGSLAAVLSASGKSLETIEEFYVRLAEVPVHRLRDLNLAGAFTLLRHEPAGFIGLVKGTRLEAELSRRLADIGIRDFSDLRAGCFTIAVDLTRGHELVCTNLPPGNLLPAAYAGEMPVAAALRASMAIPGIFAPVIRKEGVLVDGGVQTYLPLRVAHALGASKVLALRFVPQPHSGADILRGGMASLLARAADVVIDSQTDDELALMQSSGLRPTVIPLRMTDPPLFELARIPELMREGYAQTKAYLLEHPEVVSEFG